MVYGPGLQSLQKDKINTSSKNFAVLISSPKEMPPTRLPLYVDVRDLAKAHVLALERPQSIGKRLPVCAGNVFWDQAVELLRKERPQLASRLPPQPKESEQACKGPLATLDVSAAKEALGLASYHSSRDTILDSVDDLLAREQRDWS